jgi:hypothetical protein
MMRERFHMASLRAIESLAHVDIVSLGKAAQPFSGRAAEPKRISCSAFRSDAALSATFHIFHDFKPIV